MEPTVSPSGLITPVLFLVFNRPDTTAQVFSAIRNARPARLYVAADGPRPNREGEAEKVRRVRQLATAVDWPCEVRTLFRETNLGGRLAASDAITWFFSHEEQGIILEDDDLPHPSFFEYCEWALKEFRANDSIWHINGNNFAAPGRYFGNRDIAFAALAQAWGWATWRNRWARYEENPFYLAETAAKRSSNWRLSAIARTNKLRDLYRLRRKSHGWDYRWQITILNENGLVVCPKSNLISNIGDGVDASHTVNDNRANLATRALSGRYYDGIGLDRKINGWYQSKMRTVNYLGGLSFLSMQTARKLRRSLESQLARVVFADEPGPIVVASTGRSGSTLLVEALVESLIRSKFPWLTSEMMKRLIRRLSNGFADRLSDVAEMSCPVIKTHDVLDIVLPTEWKVIFIFGDPLESARSVERIAVERGYWWFEHHLYRLRSKGRLQDLFHADVLNYESQIRSWCDPQLPNVLLVPYDRLWDSVRGISEFVGFPVVLPKRMERARKVGNRPYDERLFERLKQVEGEAIHAAEQRSQSIGA
jgi:hypothetical protein